jgi:LacI family transcriptional regulator
MKRSARTQVPQVAVLLETSHGISRMMLQGILNYVRVYGPWSIHIAEGGTSDLKVPDLRHWKGSGIIGRVTTDAVARAILASRLPAVLFNPSNAYRAPAHPLSAFSRTESDSPAVGRLAAETCLGKGFTHFAFVGHPSGINWSLWRQEAYSARLKANGHTCHLYPQPPKNTGEWPAERPRLCAWLRQLPKPVALFAANDPRANHVLDACLVADIAVPYEAAVLGVNNDILICETCIPSLSSIALDAERAGYEAARMLDEKMHRPDGPRQTFLYGPTAVVSRASTESIQVGDRLVIRALEFIRINNGLTIRVSDVAEHLGVSSRWVERHFQQSLGYSIHDAIQRARMATVCTLLKETGLSLTAISKKCGFSHPNHLCSLFKREFGRTMTDYRTAGRA